MKNLIAAAVVLFAALVDGRLLADDSDKIDRISCAETDEAPGLSIATDGKAAWELGCKVLAVINAIQNPTDPHAMKAIPTWGMIIDTT